MRRAATADAVSQARKAAAGGWIGSALEYYDFFVYATAASLVFPQLFFPSSDPAVAIVAALATYGVGYVARPVGAFVLGHFGDTHGRREISGSSSLILEHAPFGQRGLYASFSLQGVQAGQILAAAVFIPLARFMPRDAFMAWGWRVPFLLSLLAVAAGYLIRRRVAETPVFADERSRGVTPRAPVVQAFTESGPDMLRVACMSLMNVIPVVTTIFGAAYAIQPAYGIGFQEDVYLWIPVLGNCVAVAVIPFVARLSDRIGRRPPIIAGSIAAGLLSFGYLQAISARNVPMAIALSLLMWGVVYQGYNAVFPSFYPELFPARTRVTAMAIAQNVGTMITALLPAVFAAVAPPGSPNVPIVVGAITCGVTLMAATAAWTTRETSHVPLADLGDRRAVP